MGPRVPEAKTSHAKVSIGTNSALVVDALGDRRTVVIGNDHATNVVYLSLGAAAVAGEGIRLNPAGGTVILDNYSGPIYAIASDASTSVIYVEY